MQPATSCTAEGLFSASLSELLPLVATRLNTLPSRTSVESTTCGRAVVISIAVAHCGRRVSVAPASLPDLSAVSAMCPSSTTVVPIVTPARRASTAPTPAAPSRVTAPPVAVAILPSGPARILAAAIAKTISAVPASRPARCAPILNLILLVAPPAGIVVLRVPVAGVTLVPKGSMIVVATAPRAAACRGPASCICDDLHPRPRHTSGLLVSGPGIAIFPTAPRVVSAGSLMMLALVVSRLVLSTGILTALIAAVVRVAACCHVKKISLTLNYCLVASV
eukprot:g6640.t1